MRRSKVGYYEDAERLKREYLFQMPQRKCYLNYFPKSDGQIRFTYSNGFLWEKYEN